MTTPQRILIHGASGRMGQALLRLAAAAPAAFQVVAAVSGRTPAQRVVEGVPHFAAAELAGVPEFDVAIDFSLPEGFDPVLALCVARGRALVSGTTGLDAARALPGWDCDIVESHHVHKKDAPSGTALSLGQAAAAGGASARYASLRAGDIVGEHLVQLAGQGERIELVHRAMDRDIFARGALQAATALAGSAPGLYSMRGLLFGAG